MKLLVSQLSEGESRFHFESQKDGWVDELAHRVTKQGYVLKAPMAIDVQLTKLEPDYYLRGTMGFAVEQSCARCAEAFSLPISHPFNVALAHVSHGKARSPELTEESEELDINFFEGNEIDLSPIIEEQFFLSLPYQSLCKEDCKGICQQCGKNKNVSDCACVARPTNPFSVLQHMVS